jgi:hypothetical protein
MKAPVDVKNSLVARRVLRMTPDAPTAAPVDFDPTAPGRPSPVETAPKVLDPAPVVDWRSSSYDLLNGMEIRDHSDTIPGELFERLFKR